MDDEVKATPGGEERYKQGKKKREINTSEDDASDSVVSTLTASMSRDAPLSRRPKRENL
jgi:hypothetical protein